MSDAFTLAELQLLLDQRVSGLSVQGVAMAKHTNAVEILGLTIFGEARNESMDGRAAVAHTANNRSLTRGHSVDERCLQKSQYSCWFPFGGAVNHERLMALAYKVVNRQSLGSDAALFNECKWIAAGVIGGQLIDRTKGSTHYLTSALYYSHTAPAWTVGHTPVICIGAHSFFAGIAWS